MDSKRESNMPPVWLNSAGGPLVVLGEGQWSGVAGSSVAVPESDYELACSVVDYCGRVAPMQETCLVLGDEPLQTTVLRTPTGFLAIRWVSCKDALTAETALADVPARLPELEPATTFVVGQGAAQLIDAASSLADAEAKSNVLSVAVESGTYRVSTERYKSTGLFDFIVHRFELAARR